MLRLMLPVLLLLLGVAGGVGAGLLLGPGDAEGPAASAQTSDDADATDDSGTAEGTRGTTPADGTEFVRLNNQFVVPIVRDGSVRSLVVMALTLEVDSGNNQAVFDREPRLRDSFLQVMFAMPMRAGSTAASPRPRQWTRCARHSAMPRARCWARSSPTFLIVDITRQDA